MVEVDGQRLDVFLNKFSAGVYFEWKIKLNAISLIAFYPEILTANSISTKTLSKMLITFEKV